MITFFKTISRGAVQKILEWEARVVLWKYKPKIAAITGNVGKTSTKDAVATELSAFFTVRKSQKSFNSEFGVPLTILNRGTGWSSPVAWIKNMIAPLGMILLPHRFPEWLVLEVGADKPGDIKKICRWLHPDVTIITQMSEDPVHIEFFESVDHLVQEKAYLVKALKPDGIVVLNKDDQFVGDFAKHAINRPFYVGYRSNADLTVSNYSVLLEGSRPTGVCAKLNYNGNSVPVTIRNCVGMHHVYPVMFAVAVGIRIGENLIAAVEAMQSYDPPKGRMRILTGLHNSVVIDDSYNSSPIAVRAALNTFSDIPTKGRKIVVLGDMRELGSHSDEAHIKAGKQAGTIADLVIAVGESCDLVEEGVKEAGGKAQSFEGSREAASAVKEMIREGDLVLVKGSQAVRTERVVKAIVKDDQKKFLVRQEREWEKR